MEPEAVAEYVEASRQLIETSPRMDEQNTRVRLIQPFLELLGWDLRSTEVELEYTIPMGSNTHHVDYALLLGDAPVAFIEAKPVNSSLSDGNLQQLRSYMRQELEVDWGILTNGQSFEVLTKNQRSPNGEEISVVQFDLDDLCENPDILELLSKEAIRSGKADEIAEQVARTNAVIAELTSEEERVANSVVEAVESEVGEFPIDLEEQSREFVQSLVSVLEEQRRFVTEDTSSETDTVADLSDPTEKVEFTEVEGYAISFSDGKVVPDANQEPHTQQSENMGQAVDYLIDEYELMNRLDLPYSLLTARRNCLINNSPTQPDGRDMRGSYELSNGYYLHTNLNKSMKQDRINNLAELVGLSVEYHGEWG